jgi:hypothetical protein
MCFMTECQCNRIVFINFYSNCSHKSKPTYFFKAFIQYENVFDFAANVKKKRSDLLSGLTREGLRIVKHMKMTENTQEYENSAFLKQDSIFCFDI